MKDDPDELLKTKGKLKPKKIDPDDFMKIKGLLVLSGLHADVIESKCRYPEHWHEQT